MWHPDFNGWKYNVDSYLFAKLSETISASISFGGDNVNVSVGYTPEGSITGTLTNCDPDKETRPAVYGDIVRHTYTVDTYNGIGTLIDTRTEYLYFSNRTYNFIEERERN